MGVCGLRVKNKFENIYEIGFHICEKFWKLGYATEAAKAMIKYAFEELKINKLFAGHNPKNENSRKVI